ncbi:MAG TPA: hypothetical protein VNM90_20950 [Haliangium sp.]|nr:hypothetical protein [Haliangium sp.]
MALAAALCCAPVRADADAPGDAKDTAPAHVFQATLQPGQRHRVAVYLAADARAGFLVIEHEGRRWTSRIYPLWWAEPADLDGDGVDALVLGIWSRTRRHDEPEPHRTIWVMAWNGDDLTPLWRGSALARPLADAFAVDLDGDGRAELVALERTRARARDGGGDGDGDGDGDGKDCVLAAYEWNGFGFAAEATRPISCAAALDRGARRVRLDGRSRRPLLRRGRLELP